MVLIVCWRLSKIFNIESIFLASIDSDYLNAAKNIHNLMSFRN